MSERYSYLKVSAIRAETPKAYSLVLEQPSPAITYKPGQFFTLILTINGEKVRRSYSASSHPSEKEIVLTIKRVEGGLVSNYIPEHVKAGDFVEVMSATGVFSTDQRATQQITLIGGGSGITPLFSILKDSLNTDTVKSILLMDCNRSEDEIIFHQQLDQLAKEYTHKFKVVHFLSQPQTRGQAANKLSSSNLKECLIAHGFHPNTFDAFVCGPNGMMETAIDGLKDMGVEETFIHKESFLNNIHVFDTPENQAAESTSSEDEDTITLIYNREEYKLHIPKNKSILEAALDKNIDLPYSCQSGLCTACMGKCTSGKVTMPDCDGLTPKEINLGYVLTCVGRPVAPHTVVEID
jgi:ring-1,2-phenylacetyl-CoA epoxidase subunit PaaE